ncbi:uncharacterized protein LOC125775820 [Bactrocera dorsalis]|uniref:Uncharacterized protein LOC125775820 n=1 Tax=Bactrocera dorsalis TaxID=27457 RepID=A0ABM3J0I6_BACDO|nr:uncharacterized protein LOC125775820 [Bactrocera dorsalis]
MNQRLTGGGPSSKPMTDFEQTDECAISSPTGSPLQLCSQVEMTPNPEQHPASPSTPSTYLSLENQDASTSVLSRSARNKLISTLIADIPKRNAAEEERRREHHEMM